MGRQVFSVLGAVLLMLLAALPAAARQEATPPSGLDGLGLPTLDITVTADAFEGVPASIAAGRYLVTVTATADTEFGGSVGFVRPEGVTTDEFLAVLAGPPEDEGAASAGTPIAAPEATPAGEGEEMGGLPPFILDATFAGGTFAPPGSSAQVVLDLGPGEWIAWGDDPEGSQAPVVFAVTGEMPADLPEPSSDTTIVMGEYVIQISAGALRAGPQLIKIENIGAQPHFIVVSAGPDGMTDAQVATVLEEEMAAEMAGTDPVYSDINPDEAFGEGPYLATQSMGTTTWHPVTLEAGTYVLVCFFPDFADGIPHAYKGMYEVVEVAA